MSDHDAYLELYYRARKTIDEEAAIQFMREALRRSDWPRMQIISDLYMRATNPRDLYILKPLPGRRQPPKIPAIKAFRISIAQNGATRPPLRDSKFVVDGAMAVDFLACPEVRDPTIDALRETGFEAVPIDNHGNVYHVTPLVIEEKEKP